MTGPWNPNDPAGLKDCAANRAGYGLLPMRNKTNKRKFAQRLHLMQGEGSGCVGKTKRPANVAVRVESAFF